MTLGCGGYGGNITSDNISPKHLLNTKRLAWELRPAPRGASAGSPDRAALPKVDRPDVAAGLDAAALSARIETLAGGAPAAPPTAPAPANQSVAAFVCEEDVRHAIKLGRTITLGERTIVTPSARDAGDAAKVFVYANWRRP